MILSFAVAVASCGAPRVRELTTDFGRFAVTRCVSGVDEHQACALVSTDSRRQRSEEPGPYLRPEGNPLRGIDQAFRVARDTWNTILRIKQSVDTLEPGSRQMAGAARAFASNRRLPIRRKRGSSGSSPRTTRGCRWSVPPPRHHREGHLTTVIA